MSSSREVAIGGVLDEAADENAIERDDVPGVLYLGSLVRNAGDLAVWAAPLYWPADRSRRRCDIHRSDPCAVLRRPGRRPAVRDPEDSRAVAHHGRGAVAGRFHADLVPGLLRAGAGVLLLLYAHHGAYQLPRLPPDAGHEGRVWLDPRAGLPGLDRRRLVDRLTALGANRAADEARGCVIYPDGTLLPDAAAYSAARQPHGQLLDQPHLSKGSGCAAEGEVDDDLRHRVLLHLYSAAVLLCVHKPLPKPGWSTERRWQDDW